MKRMFLVGLGGFVGTVLRYWLSGVAQGATRSAFPLGTLTVNVLGCFAVGLLTELVEARGYLGPDTRALVFVGLLGGFTTFSAFANETMTAAEDGAFAIVVGNVLATVALCLTPGPAVWSPT